MNLYSKYDILKTAVMGNSITKPAVSDPQAELRQQLMDDSTSDSMKDFYAERPFTNEDWKWFLKSDDQKKNLLDRQLKEYWAQVE